MSISLRRGILMLGLLLPALTLAQSPYVDLEQRFTPEQFKATGLDTLSSEQLALLNELLRADPACAEAAAAPATSEHPAAATTTVVPQPPPVAVSAGPSAPAADTGQGAPPAKAPMFIGLNDEPVKSRVIGVVSGWQPGSEFQLENGQRWKVLKGELTLRKPMSNPAITVIPGIAGRWFLQVDENLPSARVYRIE